MPGDEALQKIRNSLVKEVNTRELDVYRKKADRYPADKSLRFEVGVRLLRAGQIDEAIRELQALRADPRYGFSARLAGLGAGPPARRRPGLAQGARDLGSEA